MRVTFNTVNRHMQHVIGDRYEDLTNLQLQLSTGKRLLRPSDDPVDVANDLRLSTKISQLAQYHDNIEDGLAFMGVTDSAMNSMNTLMQRLRELALQGSNDTVGPQERVFINKEVEQLLRQVVSLMGTQYKGDYVFSGTQTRVPPYQLANSISATLEDYQQLKMAYYNAGGLAAGATVQLRNAFDNTPITNIMPGTFKLSVAGTNYNENTDYQMDYVNGTLTILNPALLQDVSPGLGNYAAGGFRIDFDYITRGKDIYGFPISTEGEIKREIENGASERINTSADEMLFNREKGVHLLETVIRFGQNLVENDLTGISKAINDIDASFSALLSAQGKNGARVNRFETTIVRNENQHTETTELQSNIEDADLAETISKYSTTENVYEAALKSAAKVIQPSLVNFL